MGDHGFGSSRSSGAGSIAAVDFGSVEVEGLESSRSSGAGSIAASPRGRPRSGCSRHPAPQGRAPLRLAEPVKASTEVVRSSRSSGAGSIAASSPLPSSPPRTRSSRSSGAGSIAAEMPGWSVAGVALSSRSSGAGSIAALSRSSFTRLGDCVIPLLRGGLHCGTAWVAAARTRVFHVIPLLRGGLHCGGPRSVHPNALSASSRSSGAGSIAARRPGAARDPAGGGHPAPQGRAPLRPRHPDRLRCRFLRVIPLLRGGLHCGDTLGATVVGTIVSVIPLLRGGLHCGGARSPRIPPVARCHPAPQGRAPLRHHQHRADRRRVLQVIPLFRGGLHRGLRTVT